MSLPQLFRLADQVALVVGGARHLGFDIASALAEAGSHLVITSRTGSAAEAAARQLNAVHGVEVLPVELEGRTDILVNNVGGTSGSSADNISFGKRLSRSTPAAGSRATGNPEYMSLPIFSRLPNLKSRSAMKLGPATALPTAFVIRRLTISLAAVGLFTVGLLPAAAFHRDSLAVPDSAKVTVTPESYAGLISPNPNGWYYKCANIVQAEDGSLVTAFQLSDNHTSMTTYIVVGRSTDHGKTWSDFQVISHANVWVDGEVWVVPQMSVLRDGRLVIICDRGQRRPGQDWPMLSTWQQPHRGMWNYIFWSSDNGRTWTQGEKIDDVGGEPGYIIEMSDGTLAYTRTDSARTDQLKNPPQPWGDIYYRNAIVFSDDGGKSWGRSTWLADSPFHGDCEVGLAELSPGKLIAATRIGLGNGQFGHPSRLLFSDDNGRTWGRDQPAPFYGQRIHIRKLQSGKLLATYRNRWGTPGSRALVFDPEENLGFQPTSHILDESRCELTADALTVRTEAGKRGAVEFSLYPAQDDRSLVEIEATLKVDEADVNGCAISAGCWVRFEPGRVSLADRPEEGFDFDTSGWHTYRIVREDGRITIFADGRQMLAAPIDDIWVREVRFGNRAVPKAGDTYSANGAVTHWQNVAVKVNNADDYSIDWRWDPSQGYPDQFRRDRVVVLDYAHPADCGYSSWTQLHDGRIVIVDYTTGELEGFTAGGKRKAPFIRAYHVTETSLTRAAKGAGGGLAE